MKQFYIYVFLCVNLLIISCSGSENTVVDNKIYSYKQNNWKSNKITKFVNDISYSATEIPLKYYILKNTDNSANINVDSIVKLNQRERIIEIEYQHIDKVDLLDKSYTNKNYEDSVKYMAFSIENDFTVITSSNDTIRCLGAHFERNFKVAPFKRALLYFNNINPEDHIQLVYNDQLFGNGTIKFIFNDIPLKL